MPALLIVLLCYLLMANALAAPVEVRLLQAPAWRVQGESRSALLPGQALDAGDSVATGPGARVVLALSEGSTVKLGENAELALRELREPASGDGVFKGFLDVVRGAFRFTTTVVGRKRDVRARIGSATIGIRGTDVWGKHEDSRDFVVLLEGRIEIERDGQSVALSEANSLFMAPRGQPALPLAPVKPEDLARWAQETEPQAAGGQRDGLGAYRLMFALLDDAARARALLEQLARAGHGAVLEEVTLPTRRAWRVSVPGYINGAEAQAAASALVTVTGGVRPWLRRDP